MSKRQIANNIIDNLLDLDLLNVADYGSETARLEAAQTILLELDKYLIIAGDVIPYEYEDEDEL